MYGDEAFEWVHAQLYQGPRMSKCPCTPSAGTGNHSVIDEFVIRKAGATRRHRLFVDALQHIQEAVDRSVDRVPRSAIRESLLRAVIELNEGILPQGIDEYIAASDAGTLPGAAG